MLSIYKNNFIAIGLIYILDHLFLFHLMQKNNLLFKNLRNILQILKLLVKIFSLKGNT